jgi:L-lactate dehydrogenase complex protein LldG
MRHACPARGAIAPAMQYHCSRTRNPGWQMTSRNEILSEIRRHTAGIEHPGPFTRGMVYDDPVAQFIATLEGVGGRCEVIATTGEATAILESIPEYASAAKRCSRVEAIGESSFELSTVGDPHDLDDVEFAVLPGEMAVAENAAVWVTTDDVRVRTLYFLTQHLALVVPKRCVHSNMHQAYEQIEVGGSPFATWISGPSKTADIEQSLVKGAHGARTLLVLLLDQ